MDFEFDHKDIVYVRIDRRRKMHATVLLRALGMSTQEILNFFYERETVYLGDEKIEKSVNFNLLAGQRASNDIVVDGEVLVRKGTKFTRAAIKKLTTAGVERVNLELAELIGKVSADDVVDEETGEVLLESNEEVTEVTLERLRQAGVKTFDVLFIDGLNVGPYLRDTLIADKVTTSDEAIMEIYRRLRPGDPPTLETARALFQNLFFNPERYDLSQVGRLKLNYKFYADLPPRSSPSSSKPRSPNGTF